MLKYGFSFLVHFLSQRISDEEESSIRREFYGGKGDKPHLGKETAEIC